MTHEKSLWRIVALGALITTLVAGISAVSYAFDSNGRAARNANNPSLNVKAEVKQGASQASNPQGYSVTGGVISSASNALQQEVTGMGDEAVMVTSYSVSIDGDIVCSSKTPSLAMEEGREIPSTGKMNFEVKTDLFPEYMDTNGGSFVWNLGTYPGLNIPEPIESEIIVSGGMFGQVTLLYENDQLFFETIVYANPENSGMHIVLTYSTKNGKPGFVPVDEITPLDFLFPNRDDTITAYLLPEPVSESSAPESSGENESTRPTTRPDDKPTESTEPVTTEPEATKPEESKPETTEPETTEPETTVPETTGSILPQPEFPFGGGAGGGGTPPRKKDTAYIEPTESIPETTGQEMTAAETTAATPDESAKAGEETPGHQEPAPADSKNESKDKSKDKSDDKTTESKSEEPETDDEADETETSEIEVHVAYQAGGDGTVRNGDVFNCTIEVQNNGSTAATDIRLRDYLPKHTSFLSASGDGVWGILNGNERVTWKIDSLKPGESRTLTLQLRVYPCTPEGYELAQTVYWQSEDEASVNAAADPTNSLTVPNITVG